MGVGEGRSRSPAVSNQRDHRTIESDMPTAAVPLPERRCLSTAPGSGLMMEVWASVASWFFRPDCSPLTTMANNNSNQLQAITTSVPSPISTSCSSRSNISSGISTSQSPTSQTNTVFSDSTSGPTICTAIRCTVPNCSCECFTPGKRHLRYCQTCQHGWVPHALDKLGSRHLFSNSVPEPVQLNAAFDIASLVLYGCQALPIRLKILLDRLFSVLQRDQVIQVLHGFGWTQEDYARGYILQESHGGTLDRWSICSPEEEPLVLQQFLRFGETRSITQQLLLAQQALQEPTLERRSLQQSRRAMSPSRRPSPPTFTPFHTSRLQTMSPHQKHHSVNFLKLPTNNSPISTNSSPPRSISTSPLSVSPLNRLQNMQPFDFRKLGSGLTAFSPRVSPELLSRRRVSETETPTGLNLSISTSLPMCLPPPPPVVSLPSSLNHSAAAMAAAAAASNNPLAAASLVASSFPGLMSAGNKSPSAADFLTGGGSSDMGTDDDEEDDENSYSALNLSRDKDSQKSPRLPRPNHVRKTTTPTKRHWGVSGLPLNLGTQFINPATGKKRVQCNVCLKTFCDKGALKIHFSAVHLREMHKCTVEGCNMMFSSRRSRNRHSANPNPKLHSPHLRRKISPHDGRSAQAHPLLIPPQTGLSLPAAAAAAALNPLNPFGSLPLLTPPPDMRHHSLAAMDFKHNLDLSIQRYEEAKKDLSILSSEDDALALTTTSSNHEDDDDDDDDGIVVVGGDEGFESDRMDCSDTNGIPDQPEDFSMCSKKQKISVSDVDEDIISNVDSNDDSLSIIDSQSLKDDSNVTTNKRKRKSQNPTKCAVPIMMDDDSDGDSSNDGVFGEREIYSVEEEAKDLVKGPLDDQQDLAKNDEKTEINDSNEKDPGTLSPINLDIKNPDLNANESNEKNSSEIKTSLAPLFTIEKKEKTTHENKTVDEQHVSSTESNKSDEIDSLDSSNALRHLENMSQGHFGDLMSKNLQGGVQGSQYPPLGFMVTTEPASPARSQASSVDSSNGSDSPDENSQNQIFGHFDNGQFISTMDVPIDKDNPRRCTACGKIFQNHFGVKTHYQNVHLKLMHKCNVDGCNAAFPSKRSRDRHSANLNLHRKLLSTSSTEKGGANLFLEKSHFSFSNNSTLHGEFLARLYAEEALKNHLPPPSTNLELIINGERPSPLLLPPLSSIGFPIGGFNHFPQVNGSSVLDKKEKLPTSNLPQPVMPSLQVHCIEEDMPTPDKDGKLPCKFCKTTLSEATQLKEHYEQNHLSEMFRCTQSGCSKLFLSRTMRNIHAENCSYHKIASDSGDS